MFTQWSTSLYDFVWTPIDHYQKLVIIVKSRFSFFHTFHHSILMGRFRFFFFLFHLLKDKELQGSDYCLRKLSHKPSLCRTFWKLRNHALCFLKSPMIHLNFRFKIFVSIFLWLDDFGSQRYWKQCGTQNFMARGGGGMSVCGLWFTNWSHRVATTLRVAAGDTKLFLIAQPKKKWNTTFA